jgi:hypothetical protein
MFKMRSTSTLSNEVMPPEIFDPIVDLIETKPWLKPRYSLLIELIRLGQSLEEQKLILQLISRFHFIDSDALGQNLKHMVHQITVQWNLTPSDTIILGASLEDKSKSSDMVSYFLKPAFQNEDGWTSHHFKTRMRDVTSWHSSSFNAVLVDDFIGTGTSVADKVKWLRDKFTQTEKNVKIFVCVFAAMRESRVVLDGLGIEYHANSWLQKGISDFYAPQELQTAVDNMTILEEKLCDKIQNGRLRKFRFGFKRSEALYYLEHGNIPNNVFPIFWWQYLKEKRRRTPLFPRLG